jgi:hypothetical protein
MWPDSPNEFTYNLLCGTKRALGKLRCLRPTVALKRTPVSAAGAHSLSPFSATASHTSPQGNKLRLDLCVQLEAALRRAGLEPLGPIETK